MGGREGKFNWLNKSLVMSFAFVTNKIYDEMSVKVFG
jgi:hypothetical protein